MENLRKLQLVQAMILNDIANICNENNLKYYLIGGTLLGAVRHGGFIPWDDDIDIVMYREDYNKLIEIIQKEYTEKFFVQTFYTDKYYTRYIAKIRLNGTKLVEKYLSNSKSNNGIYIDIFPLDYVKKNKGIEMAIRGKIVRWLFAIKNAKHGIRTGNSITKTILQKTIGLFCKLIPDVCINKLFDYVCSKDNKKDCKYTTNFASHFKWKKQLYNNEIFGEGTKIKFEDYYFNAPNEYKTILERLYGKNYMQLPPKEKRENHNIYELDLGNYEDKI